MRWHMIQVHNAQSEDLTRMRRQYEAGHSPRKIVKKRKHPGGSRHDIVARKRWKANRKTRDNDERDVTRRADRPQNRPTKRSRMRRKRRLQEAGEAKPGTTEQEENNRSRTRTSNKERDERTRGMKIISWNVRSVRAKIQIKMMCGEFDAKKSYRNS